MLVTLMAMQGVWLAWREYQQRKTVRRRLLLAGTSLASGRPATDPRPPFWSTLLARYHREMRVSRDRRALTRRAIARINMASDRRFLAGMRRG